MNNPDGKPPHQGVYRSAKDLPLGLTDLNGDGRADLLRFQWNGKQAVLIDEAGRFPWPDDAGNSGSFDWEGYFNRAFDVKSRPTAWNPLRQGWGSHTILVDVNDDGVFDSPGDLHYSVVDIDGDGQGEVLYFIGGPNVYVFFALNGEPDLMDTNNIFAGYAFKFESLSPVRKPGQVGPINVTNHHGSGFHLTHDPGEAVWGGDSLAGRMTRFDPASVWWESPIAWYDFDGDGRTNMVVRAVDGRPGLPRGADGRVQEFEIAFELNGNTTPLRQQSLDMQITFTAYRKGGLEFADFEDDLAFLRGREDADFLFTAMPQWRTQTRRKLIPYLDAYRIGTDHRDWEGVWLLFDEDDDDCRWEEMFSAHEDGSDGGSNLYYFADKLGDRWEVDRDFSGRGRLYVGRFDGRIHLYGAERGQWSVDYHALFKYVYDEPPYGPVPPEGLLYDLVKYADANGNGFIDRIEYCTAQFGREAQTLIVHRVIDLTAFGDNADVCPLIDLQVDAPLTGWRVSKWDGRPLTLEQLNESPCGAGFDKIKRLYQQVADAMWDSATKLYAAAKAAGLTVRENEPECAVGPQWSARSPEDRLTLTDVTMRPGYASLTSAPDLRARYHRGYWLREKVFADILDQTPQDEHDALCRLYYTGRIDDLAAKLATLQPRGR